MLPAHMLDGHGPATTTTIGGGTTTATAATAAATNGNNTGHGYGLGNGRNIGYMTSDDVGNTVYSNNGMVSPYAVKNTAQGTGLGPGTAQGPGLSPGAGQGVASTWSVEKLDHHTSLPDQMSVNTSVMLSELDKMDRMDEGQGLAPGSGPGQQRYGHHYENEGDEEVLRQERRERERLLKLRCVTPFSTATLHLTHSTIIIPHYTTITPYIYGARCMYMFFFLFSLHPL